MRARYDCSSVPGVCCRSRHRPSVYVADAGPRGAGFEVINGGVRNLSNGSAHAATNAEMQMLLVDNPKVRMLLTVSEGLYRIIARQSAGIRTLADLKGNRTREQLATFIDTSILREALAGL